MKLRKNSLIFSLIFFALSYSNYSYASISLKHSHGVGDGAHHKTMHGLYGYYPLTRDVSGTSWEPDSTPASGWMKMFDRGMLMLQGYFNQVFDHQGGPRGGEKNFSTSMLMLGAQQDLPLGIFGFQAMFSLDPTMGRSGYPLLLQSGETANGRTPLIDRQHPHDAFMQLAVSFSMPITPSVNTFIYLGLPGEPALGPPDFMMRWSGLYNPEAPIGHHWLDATHTSYGVITLGTVMNTVKLEASAFKGREPDQFRWNIDSAKLDSGSVRVSVNPYPDWSFQFSYGYLKSPEQLEPHISLHRTTASLSYNKHFGAQNNWQTLFAWGQNKNIGGTTSNAYLLESTLQIHLSHTFFGRVERVQKNELVQESDYLSHSLYTVNKMTVGYIFECPPWHHAQFGLGGLVSGYALPSDLNDIYQHPRSYMLYARLSIA